MKTTEEFDPNEKIIWNLRKKKNLNEIEISGISVKELKMTLKDDYQLQENKGEAQWELQKERV